MLFLWITKNVMDKILVDVWLYLGKWKENWIKIKMNKDNDNVAFWFVYLIKEWNHTIYNCLLTI